MENVLHHRCRGIILVSVRRSQVEDLGLPRGLIGGMDTVSWVVLPDRGGAWMSARDAMVVCRDNDRLERALVLIYLRRAYRSTIVTYATSWSIRSDETNRPHPGERFDGWGEVEMMPLVLVRDVVVIVVKIAIARVKLEGILVLHATQVEFWVIFLVFYSILLLWMSSFIYN
jgi:hypothetical protein